MVKKQGKPTKKFHVELSTNQVEHRLVAELGLLRPPADGDDIETQESIAKAFAKLLKEK